MAEELAGVRSTLKAAGKEYRIYRLDGLEKQGLGRLERLPFSIRVILEAVLRHHYLGEATREDVTHLASWKAIETNRPS
ncbi:MAG TPA: hypothetical protein VMT46_14090, partial [Anaerolineaceae bacterium]|nr:hypothetical protein [Anaerolineaceae bacterium]